MPTTTQYTFSYQTESFSSSSPYDFPRFAPIYMNTNGSWGKKNWSSVYILTFLKDDDITFYSENYFHIYSSKDSGSLQFYKDSYSLSTGKLVNSFGGTSWDINDYPFLGFVCKSGKSNSSTVMIGKWPSYHDYLSNTNGIGYMNYFDIGDMISENNSSSTLSLSNMRSATSFTPDSNLNDDWGFILSADPFELFSYQTSIDFDKIPDNYTITINGDTIYDYSITNPDTGDTSTINEYVTNNYTYITNNNGDNSGSSSGTFSGDVNVGGNVTVSGDVNVGGEISIKADPIDINVNTQPIDINVNVNGGGSSGSGSSEAAGVQFDQDVSLNNYYDWMNEQTSGFSGFMSQFFSWLPADVVVLICAGFACVILARFLGR